MYFYDNSLKNVHTHCALPCDVLKENLDFNDKNLSNDASPFFKTFVKKIGTIQCNGLKNDCTG